MPVRSLQLVLVNTPIGALGSGRGGGVELTLASLIQGLVRQNHRVTLVSAKGSTLPSGCTGVTLVEVEGVDQPAGSTLMPMLRFRFQGMDCCQRCGRRL